jgi:hypothetical protein
MYRSQHTHLSAVRRQLKISATCWEKFPIHMCVIIVALVFCLMYMSDCKFKHCVLPCNTGCSIRDIILCFVYHIVGGLLWSSSSCGENSCRWHGHSLHLQLQSSPTFADTSCTSVTYHFGSDISALCGIVDCAVVSLLQVVQSTGRNPLASSHVWLNAGGCDSSVCNSTWRAASFGPLFRWLGSNTTDCGPSRTVTGSILSYHWCECHLWKVVCGSYRQRPSAFWWGFNDS